LLDRQAISALEPSIVPIYKVGLLHTQTASVDSPGGVVKAYAKMLAGAGGEIRKSDIKSIIPTAKAGACARRWRAFRAPCVVALGPWSADICGRSAIAFRWRSSAATTANSNRTRHVHCSVDPMMPMAVF